MKVSVQYAESHFPELYSAAVRGEEVEVEGNGASLLLVSKPAKADTATPALRSRAEIFGSAKGKIWMADDWDSPETNEQIARLFNDGPLFPDEDAA